MQLAGLQAFFPSSRMPSPVQPVLPVLQQVQSPVCTRRTIKRGQQEASLNDGKELSGNAWLSFLGQGMCCLWFYGDRADAGL